MYRLWTCRASDYKLSRCPAIKMKTSISWANILWRNATCEVCGFYQQHSLRSSYAMYQAVLGCLTHTLRLRSRKSSNNSNASTNPHTKCFWVVVFFCSACCHQVSRGNLLNLSNDGVKKSSHDKRFFVCFVFFFIIWNGDWNVKEQKVGLKKKRIQFALCLSMV